MCGGVVGWPTTRLGRQRPPHPCLGHAARHLSPLAAGPRRRVLALAFRDALGFEDDEDDDEEDNDREQQLFSASADRNVKHWQAEAGSYVEALFGHSSAVSALDCGFDERPLSGGRDRCARVWKIRDETHLVFRAPRDAGCPRLRGRRPSY